MDIRIENIEYDIIEIIYKISQNNKECSFNSLKIIGNNKIDVNIKTEPSNWGPARTNCTLYLKNIRKLYIENLVRTPMDNLIFIDNPNLYN